jgi:hypothetical protein
MEFRYQDRFPETYFCFDITWSRRGLSIELVLFGRSFFFTTAGPITYVHGN